MFLALMLCFGAQIIRGDGQAWVSNSLDLKISPSFVVGFQQEQRFDEMTIMDPYLSNVEAKISVNTGKRTQLSIAYRREGKSSDGDVSRENRMFFDVSRIVFKNETSSLDVRLRCESRNFEAGAGTDHWRFRLRLRWRTRVAIGAIMVKPFMAIESFGDTKADALDRYRFYAGLVVPLGKHAGLVLSYIRQGTRDKESLDILGTGFKLSF